MKWDCSGVREVRVVIKVCIQLLYILVTETGHIYIYIFLSLKAYKWFNTCMCALYMDMGAGNA